MTGNHHRLGIRYVGGPTALLRVGGLQLLTDPTFDPPGEHPVGNRVLVKTAGPAVGPDGLGAVDAVLLSHDQHPDNLDTLGRAYLARVPLVLSTASARDRLGGGHRVRPGRRGPAHGVRQRRQRLAAGGGRRGRAGRPGGGGRPVRRGGPGRPWYPAPTSP